MLAFLHPLGSLFTGIALAAFGAFYSVLRHPPASAFQVLAQAMPDAIAVIIFGIGITAIVVGIALLVSGIRGVRSRTREINRAYGSDPRHRRRSHRDEYEAAWDDELHPAYR